MDSVEQGRIDAALAKEKRLTIMCCCDISPDGCFNCRRIGAALRAEREVYEDRIDKACELILSSQEGGRKEFTRLLRKGFWGAAALSRVLADILKTERV